MVGKSSFLLASIFSCIGIFFVGIIVETVNINKLGNRFCLTNADILLIRFGCFWSSQPRTQSLRVSGLLSYFSPLSLSRLCSALIISFHIKLQLTRVLQCCCSKPKNLIKFRQRLVKFNVTNSLCYCFSSSCNSIAASVRIRYVLQKGFK